eukprot:8868103-Ditylum_brightwellii.AAC.1
MAQSDMVHVHGRACAPAQARPRLWLRMTRSPSTYAQLDNLSEMVVRVADSSARQWTPGAKVYGGTGGNDDTHHTTIRMLRGSADVRLSIGRGGPLGGDYAQGAGVL